MKRLFESQRVSMPASDFRATILFGHSLCFVCVCVCVCVLCMCMCSVHACE